MTNEELVKQIQQGNKDLMGELYEQNKPVIRIIAEQITNNQDEFEDALQDAYFGLVAAVKGFDGSKGYKFTTYYIRQAIKRGKSTIQHIPEHLIDRVRKIKQAENELSQQLQRTPTKAEIALKTGLTVGQIRYAIRVVKPPITIDTPLEDNLTIADTIADDSIDFENDIAEADERQYNSNILHEAVDNLPPQQREIIRLYYFEGMNQREIGELMGFPRQRIHQIVGKAKEHLKTSLIQQLIDETI